MSSQLKGCVLANASKDRLRHLICVQRTFLVVVALALDVTVFHALYTLPYIFQHIRSVGFLQLPDEFRIDFRLFLLLCYDGGAADFGRVDRLHRLIHLQYVLPCLRFFRQSHRYRRD